MAANLVSLIMQFLTPDMIGRIASALGLDRNNTQTAIGAAVPGLLAGLSGVAAQPGGAQKLVDAVRQQTGALGSFVNMIGASGQSSLIEKGSQILSSLLGGRDQTALAGAVGKYAGLGQTRVDRCWECWPRLSWAPSASSRARVPLMPVPSPAFFRARRTILLRHCPRGSPTCLAAQGYSTRLAARRRQQPRPRAKQPG